jgi:methylenetetrahydrofolate dehydrogenase (NADP+)/methenyltetrahydrofolate cyclohydrolase
MTARILDGKRIAEDLLDNLKAQVDARIAAGKVPRTGRGAGRETIRLRPCMSEQAPRRRVGIRAIDYDLPADTSDEQLLAPPPAQRRSGGPRHPRPAAAPGHRDATAIHRIDPRKDVDGFHPRTSATWLRQFGLRPCTLAASHALLAYTDRRFAAERDDRGSTMSAARWRWSC